MAAVVFPYGIWDIIYSIIDRDTLRALRRTSTFLQDIATPILFSTIILRQNIYSAYRAQAITCYPALVRHVRCLHLRDGVPAFDPYTYPDRSRGRRASLGTFEDFVRSHITPQSRQHKLLSKSHVYLARCSVIICSRDRC